MEQEGNWDMFVLGLCLKPLPSFLPGCYKVSNFEKLSSVMSLLLFAASTGSSVVVFCFIPDTVDALIARRKQAGQTFQITSGLIEELGNRLCSYLVQTGSFV